MIRDLVFFPQICMRKSDRTTWEPSHPGHAGFDGWYFREIDQIWWFVWRRTGKIWKLSHKVKNAHAQFEICSGWRKP